MKRLFVIMALLLSVNIFAQDSIERNIEDFKELKVYDLINVKLVKAEENKVIISGDNKNDVEINNAKGVLRIKMRLGDKFDGNKTDVTLYYKDIIIIDVNEGAYVTSEAIFKQDKIELRAQEGGLIKLILDVAKNEIKAVTGGEIEVSGSATRQDISINTGGKFHGKLLKSETTYVAIRAAGEAHVDASKLVDAKVRAGGSVYIYGKPETVNESKVFGGSIKRME